MIDGWATFWTFVLIGTAILFTCLAVAVAIGSFFDIRTFLKTIDRQHKNAEEEQDVGRTRDNIADQGATEK